MWHTMQVLVGMLRTNLCSIGCPEVSLRCSTWTLPTERPPSDSFLGSKATGDGPSSTLLPSGLTLGSLEKLFPRLPYFAHCAEWTGLRSLAYTTWQAEQP